MQFHCVIEIEIQAFLWQQLMRESIKSCLAIRVICDVNARTFQDLLQVPESTRIIKHFPLNKQRCRVTVVDVMPNLQFKL